VSHVSIGKPNTFSFIVVVFEDEITDADRAGKETPMEALGRLTVPGRERSTSCSKRARSPRE
jgi:hypothetical protein